jgi:hypothetical protein
VESSPWANFAGALGHSQPAVRSDCFSTELSEYFLKAYVDSAANAKAEPVLVGGQEIKTKLQTEIEGSWYGQKSGNDALTAAAEEADRLLQENK